VTIPEVSSEAEGAIRLFVQGDVIRAFELNDVIAFGFVFVIAPSVSVLEQGQPQLLTRQAGFRTRKQTRPAQSGIELRYVS
jgi:hypothetical protein